jgi:hypothetical protein
MDEYAKKITDEFNRFSRMYEEALKKDGAIIEESFAAFMCNAISSAISRSSHKEVRDYFSANADY